MTKCGILLFMQSTASINTEKIEPVVLGYVIITVLGNSF